MKFFSKLCIQQAHAKAMLLVLSTITADHLNQSLAAVVAESENNRSNIFIFEESAHIFLSGSDVTILADQHVYIKSMIQEV